MAGKAHSLIWTNTGTSAAAGALTKVNYGQRPPPDGQPEPDRQRVATVFAGTAINALRRQAVVQRYICPPWPVQRQGRVQRAGFAGIGASAAKGAGIAMQIDHRAMVRIAQNNPLRAGARAIAAACAQIDHIRHRPWWLHCVIIKPLKTTSEEIAAGGWRGGHWLRNRAGYEFAIFYSKLIQMARVRTD